MKSRTLGDPNMPFSALQYPVLVSIKYDGRRTRVVVKDGEVKFYSSGSKYFTLVNPKPFNKFPDGVYYAEMMGENVKGKLGDRVHSGIQATMYTNTSKGIPNNHKPSWKIFYYVSLEDDKYGRSSMPFLEMSQLLSRLAKEHNESDSFVEFTFVNNYSELMDIYTNTIKDGWEGLMVAGLMVTWNDSTSRRKDYVKLKAVPTLKAVVVGIQSGEPGKKYEYMIGSLVCEYNGKSFKVGSGLSDSDRLKDDYFFIGKTIKVSYEQLINGVPQQPRYEYIEC